MPKNLFGDLYPHSPKTAKDLLRRANLIESITKTTRYPLGDEFKEFLMFASWDKIKAVGELLLK